MNVFREANEKTRNDVAGWWSLRRPKLFRNHEADYAGELVRNSASRGRPIRHFYPRADVRGAASSIAGSSSSNIASSSSITSSSTAAAAVSPASYDDALLTTPPPPRSRGTKGRRTEFTVCSVFSPEKTPERKNYASMDDDDVAATGICLDFGMLNGNALFFKPHQSKLRPSLSSD